MFGRDRRIMLQRGRLALAQLRRDLVSVAFTLLQATAISGALVHGALAGEAGRQISVSIDEAKLISLPKGAHQIILGNPFIVGLTRVPNSPAAVLTGRAFGETNMIVLDDLGAIVVDATIRVVLPSGTDLIVVRGGERSTYGCKSNCELRMQLGDGGGVAQGAAAQIATRNGLAAPGSAAAAPPNPKAGGAL
jgi:hypothetical protein